MRCPSATWLAFAVAMFATPAEAQRASTPLSTPDKEACVKAFDRGQRAQSDRSLRRAQSELIVCSQESCPNVLRADCAGVLAEVRSALPTIVLAADDGNGHELTDVKVYAGTELLAPQLDGHAIAVDPGTFELRFERAGQKPVTTSRTIREGEKSRVIRVSLTDGSAPGGGGTGGAGGSGALGGTDSGRRSAVGWVLPGSLAAVGVAGLGVALFARLDFDSGVDDLRGSCAPECSQEQRADLSSTLVTSNVALGIGIGALAAAVVTWFVTGPSSPSTAAATATNPPGVFRW